MNRGMVHRGETPGNLGVSPLDQEREYGQDDQENAPENDRSFDDAPRFALG